MRYVAGFLVLLVLFAGCTDTSTLTLATTTSTYDSGLLDYLLPDFEESGVKVHVVSVGTGQAIKIAEAGDADVLLVHAPAAEKKFVEDGFGIGRECVMYNDFIILGPKEDPAGIKGLSVSEALSNIVEKEADFISRGDDSGTHKKELALWKAAGLENDWDGYKEVGAGMGGTLRIADETQAYTMADRGTYISQKDNLELVILVEGDDVLLNPYGAIRVNPGKHSVNAKGSAEFMKWIMSDATQTKIGEFRKNGEVLFKPLHGECIGG